jgi:4a-hydroxytetrahydrobiopterin dehydratase
MSDLASDRCKDGAPALSPEDVRKHLATLPDWNQKDNQIVRTLNFKNYYETMAFVNALAWVSHQQNHHPDLEVGYNKCTVRYSTHSAGGLSRNDFICAAKIEQLLAL